MFKVAITGANGMIGRHMVALIENKNVSLLSISRNDWDLSKWKSFEELDRIFLSVDVVFHFGAALPKNKSNLIGDNKQTKTIFDVNIRSCLNLAEWALLRNKAVVFLSGSTVYKNPHGVKIRENATEVKNGLGGLYGYSKLLAEKVFEHFVAVGLKAIILRPSSVYGYGLGEDKLVARYLDKASKGLTIEVMEPKNKINFIHAFDVSNAAWNAYKNQAWGVFNVASDNSVSVMDLAKSCVLVAKMGGVKIPPAVKHEDQYTRFDLDCSKARRLFSFEPVLSLHDGLKLMFEKKMVPCKKKFSIKILSSIVKTSQGSLK